MKTHSTNTSLKLSLSIAIAFGGMRRTEQRDSERLFRPPSFPASKATLTTQALDVAGQKIFVAAEDNGTLRVIDLKTGKLMMPQPGEGVQESAQHPISSGAERTLHCGRIQGRASARQQYVRR